MSPVARMPESSGGSREKILDVAESLFARRGFAGVGLREIAQAVGLGKSSLFHHFDGKAQLYLVVLGRVLGRIEGRLGGALASEGTAMQRLDRWIEALIDAFAETPPSARLLLRGLVEDEQLPPEAEALPEFAAVNDTLDRILAGVYRLLVEGQRAGEIRTGSPPQMIQTLIGAVVYHFASGELGERVLGAPLLSAESVRERKAELVRLFHTGIAACPGPRQEDPS